MVRRIGYSFATKLNLYILFSLFLLGGLGFAVFHHYAIRSLEKQAFTKLDDTAEKASLKIVRLLRTIEKIPENLCWIIPSYVTSPDAIFGITRQVVEHNDEIFGCAIAFEPHYFPEKGHYFAPYSYMQGDSVITTEIDRKYDYYRKNWYRIAKELNTSRWSRPYHELSAHDIITTTYSVPLRDDNENVIGIFSVDLSINWLISQLDSIKPYEDSYNIIINQEGKYILHPGEDFFLKDDLSEYGIADEVKDSSALKIVHQILNGEKGNGIFHNDGTKYYIYHTPIKGTEWFMATIFPYSYIFAGLNRFNSIVLICFFLLMCLIATICTVTIRKITNPLKKFAASAHSIANGNFKDPLPDIHSNDEMQELHSAFSEMQFNLEKYMDNLAKTSAAKEKMESELRIAHDIQMSMLPKSFPPFPDRNEIDLYAVLYPARQVGGDLYDFFIRDNCLYFAIGDVSGKGIPASLLMASTISLMRSFSIDHSSPAQVTCFLNNSIAERNETDMFVTLFCGVLNLETGLMKYCNAGHTPPILTHPDQNVSLFEIHPDIPLGILKNHNYQEYTYQFSSGSGILLYTDGVTDAVNEQGEFYTRERLVTTVRQLNKLHPHDFVETILQDIRQHVKSHILSDDLTMLTFIYGKEWKTSLRSEC